jgi:hypothetical protein
MSALSKSACEWFASNARRQMQDAYCICTVCFNIYIISILYVILQRCHAWSRDYPCICLDGLRKTIKTSVGMVRCLDQDSYQVAPEHESTVLPLRQPARFQYFANCYIYIGCPRRRGHSIGHCKQKSVCVRVPFRMVSEIELSHCIVTKILIRKRYYILFLIPVFIAQVTKLVQFN